MTKAIIVLLISGYSLTRLIMGAYQIYMETLRLPLWVLGVTGFCCFWALAAAVAFLFGKLKNRTLHLVLFLIALGAALNMTGLIYNPVNYLTVYDMILTGTFFDIFFFLGALTIPLRDLGQAPGRMARGTRGGPLADTADPDRGEPAMAGQGSKGAQA